VIAAGAGARRSIHVLAGLLVLGACRHAPLPMQPVTADGRLFHSHGSIYSTPRRIIVRDGIQWPEIWRTVTNASPSVGPARPDVDFTRDMVLIAAAGDRPGGDEIRFDSVAPRWGGLHVVVTTQQGCRGSIGMGAPIDVIRVPRIDGPVQFIERVGLTPRCAAAVESSNAR
jgi:hypothetical protein